MSLVVPARLLTLTTLCRFPARELNTNRAVVAKIKRAKFSRLYPVTTVLPDGSTITVKYHEPKSLIRLPLDYDAASEEEKKKILAIRRPRTKLRTSEDTGKAFDPMKYVRK